jgi:DNA primase
MLIDYRAVRRQIPMQRVLDLIGYRATFRRGQQLRGPCPLHATEPSHPRCFSVDLTTGLFRCFFCGAQGNQLDLWAKLHSLSLYTAALDLCHHAAVRIPPIDHKSAAR